MLTPDLEALIDAVRESASSYTYSAGYTDRFPEWWVIAATKEVSRENNGSLHDAYETVREYVYKRMLTGDESASRRWLRLDDVEKWEIMARVFGDSDGHVERN
jgi:hypothetical protein